jgi:hypothetical protein
LKIIWLTQTEVPLAWSWKLERLDLLRSCLSASPSSGSSCFTPISVS